MSSGTSLFLTLVAFFVRMLVILASVIVSMFPIFEASASSFSMICSSLNVSSSIAAANSRFSLQSSNRKTWRYGSLWAEALFPGSRTVYHAKRKISGLCIIPVGAVV